MTGRRVTLLLIAALVIIALGSWLSSRGPANKPGTAGQRVLPGLQAAVNSVTEVRLSKGDGTRTTLRKGNTDWMIGERDYPADSGKVRKLLLDLGALNVVERKTSIAENYPQLGVEDTSSPKATGTRVDAVAAGKTYSLIVGKSSSGKSGYVRVADARQSELAAPMLTVESDPRRWLDHTLVDISQERIKEMSVKPADGAAYTAARDKKETSDFAVTPLPKGRELSSPAAADPIAGSLASLSLDDVQRAPAAPTGKVSHTVFRTFDGLELDVAGRKDGTKTLISITARSTAHESEAEARTLQTRLQGWEFEIPSYKFDGMFRPLEDLLKKPEPPAKPGAKSGKAKGAITPTAE